MTPGWRQVRIPANSRIPERQSVTLALERPSNTGPVRRAKKARLSACCACLPDASFAEQTRMLAAAPVTAEDVRRGELEIDAMFREA